MADEIEDFSKYHKPVSSFLGDYPKSVTEWNQLTLSKEQIEFYENNGYLTNVKILSEEQVNILLKELELISTGTHKAHKLWYEFLSNESEDPNFVLFHALGAWRLSSAYHDLLWHPKIVKASSQLLGNTSLRFWHDQLFCKPAKQGSCVAWHQDYSYWTRTTPLAHITVHIALDDQTVENGCLHYIPGSHKWNLLPITSRHFGDMESIKNVLTDEQKQQFKPVPMLLKKGEAAFHHGLTVHGSYGNKSDAPRRATVINYFSDGVSSNSNDVLLEGVPVVEKGKKMEGQFFPLVYESQKEIDEK